MDCREVREHADAFAAGALDRVTADSVAAHVADCPTCREEVEGLRRLRLLTKAAFDGSPDLRPRPEFTSELAMRLRGISGSDRRPVVTRRGWLAWAASTVLAVAAGWGWREWSAARLAALLRLAAGDHRRCALSFALDEPPISLEEAARRFGGVHGLLEDLAPAPSVLAGGAITVVDRHSCVYGGQRFSHIVLKYKDELVSVLVTDQVGRDLDGQILSRPPDDGLQIATIGNDGTVFVVSSLPGSDVRDVGRAMAEPLRRALTGS